jgi:hypothetical protein
MKMKIYILGAIISISMLGFVGNAHSSLILDISDNGSGTTRWQFSGTGATVTDTFDLPNTGFYGENFSPSSPVNVVAPAFFSIISGSGAFMVNSTSYAFLDVFLHTDGGGTLGPHHSFAFSKIAGDNLSWSGDIITSAGFSLFNVGSYSTSSMIVGGQIDSSLIVNVIPEPASMALIGLVAGGIYFKRRFFAV